MSASGQTVRRYRLQVSLGAAATATTMVSSVTLDSDSVGTAAVFSSLRPRAASRLRNRLRAPSGSELASGAHRLTLE